MPYILIISLLFIIGFYFLFRWRAKHQIQQYKDIKFEEDRQSYKKELDQKYRIVKEEQEREIKKLDNEITQKKEFNESMLKMREEELERIMDAKRAAADEAFAKEIDYTTRQIQEWVLSAQEVANENQRGYRAQLQLQTEITEKELQQVQAYLAEFKAKQDAVNEEILRRRALEEKQDFYHIQISDAAKEDITILNEIRPRLKNIELFNKFIYDNYIARPLKEMVQRVLAGRNPSGIYKVTNVDTGEIYIGKSVKIADRFQNHVKAAQGLGGVAESQFQRALKKYGVDKFTWELIEEVDKDKLTERERYYINFYNTKQFGYNQREG